MCLSRSSGRYLKDDPAVEILSEHGRGIKLVVG